MANDSGVVIALVGDLGSGKTTFVQGFSEGLEIKQRIISPTFILMRKYNCSDPGSEHEDFYHIDLYRLEENIEAEVRNLGLEDVWNTKNSIVVIEWAEKIKDILPKNTVWITFKVLEDNSRKITLNDQ